MRLYSTITIRVVLDNVPEDEQDATNRLHQHAINHIAANGFLSGDSEAVVETWDSNVTSVEMLSPTREQIMAAYDWVWDKYPTCIQIAKQAMAGFIAARLDSLYGNFSLLDCNIALVKTHLDEEIAANKVPYIKRGKASGFYRSKSHLPKGL
jgi:hypothetical protein